MAGAGEDRIQGLAQANERLASEIAERKRAEGALRESEERYRAIAEDIPVLICRFLPGGEITYVNKAYREYFKRTSEQLVGLSFLSLIPEEHRTTAMASISALAVEAPVESQEHPVIAPGGEVRWQRWTNRALFDDKGNPVAYQAIGEDITDRKQTEEALRESTDRLHQIANTIEDVCWITDWIDNRVLFASPAYEKIWGRSLQSLYENAEDWANAIHPDDRQTVWQNFRRLEEKECFDEEYRIIRADGSMRWIRDRGYPIHDEHGQVYRVAGIAQDITEHKNAEDALRESEERFQMAVTGTSDGLWYSNLVTGQDWWSQRLRELIGFSESELPSSFESWKSLLHPAEREDVLEALRRHLEENQPYDIEYRFRTKAAGYCWFQSRGVAVRGAGGRAVRMAGSIRDVTERKRAESALRVADRLSAIGTMVAGVAHEVNSPLTAILGLSELMAKDSTLNTRARQIADEIVGQAVRAAKIVDDLLGMAQIGRITSETVQVNHLIQRSLKHLRDSNRLEGVEIVEDYDDDLPETCADPYRLEQVFVNIIRNAGDALREVTSIRRLVVRTRRSRDQIRLSFTDTGHGVEAPDKVFDPFYTTKDIGEGSGLGLSVSLGIIRDHGGEITTEAFDESTQFLVTLPIRSAPIIAKKE